MTSHLSLTLVFGALFLGWLGLSAYAVGGRAAYDLRARRVAAARTSPGRRALSGRSIRRAARDAALPLEVAEALAFEAGANIGLERLRVQAASHRTELGKWRRLEALRILSVVDERSALPLLEDALRADEDLATAAAAVLGTMASVPAGRVLADAVGDATVPDSRLAGYLDSHPRDVADVVLGLAADPDSARRYWGVSLLTRHAGDPAALEQLRRAAADGEPDVRAAAAEALGSAPDGGIAELRALVADEAWFVRAHAARALGARRAPGAATAVAPLLADSNWWVRSSAKDALASFGRAAESAVASYLEHADAFARNGAAEVLERIGVVDVALAAAVDAPGDHGKRRYARAIAAASADAYGAALERAPEAMRQLLIDLVADAAPPLEEAA